MTTFNFTVRATDDRGAFADREFSIKVRNTIIDRYIAQGASGLYTSPDAVTWTLRPGIGTYSLYNQTDIVHGNGRWMGIASGTQYMLSMDGVNWTPYTFPAAPSNTQNAFVRIGFGNGKFVMTMATTTSSGVSAHRIFTSVDGINWVNPVTKLGATSTNSLFTASTTAFTPVPAPVYGNGRWSIGSPASTTTIFYSDDDMVTWNGTTNPMNNLVGSMLYVNGLWVAGTFSGTAALCTSVDGIVWSLQTLPGGYNDANWSIRKILYGNGRLVALVQRSGAPNSSNSPGNQVFTSIDGVTWTGANMGVAFANAVSTTVYNLTGAFHNGVFVIGASGGAANTAGVYVSEDGVTWTHPVGGGISGSTALYAVGGLNQD